MGSNRSCDDEDGDRRRVLLRLLLQGIVIMLLFVRRAGLYCLCHFMVCEMGADLGLSPCWESF